MECAIIPTRVEELYWPERVILAEVNYFLLSLVLGQEVKREGGVKM